jgi:hypothetical protein
MARTRRHCRAGGACGASADPDTGKTSRRGHNRALPCAFIVLLLVGSLAGRGRGCIRVGDAAAATDAGFSARPKLGRYLHFFCGIMIVVIEKVTHGPGRLLARLVLFSVCAWVRVRARARMRGRPGAVRGMVQGKTRDFIARWDSAL